MSTSTTVPALLIPQQRIPRPPATPPPPRPAHPLRPHRATLTRAHVAQLTAVHRGMLRDVDRLATWAAEAAAGDAAALSRRHAVASYARQALTVLARHHRLEDVGVLPVLTLAASDVPPALDALEALGADHRAIAPVLYRVRRAADRLAAAEPHPIALRFLAADTAALARLLHAHAADEQRIAVPILLRCVSAEAWAPVVAAAVRTLSRSDLAFLGPWLAACATPGELAEILAAAPRSLRASARARATLDARVRAAFG